MSRVCGSVDRVGEPVYGSIVDRAAAQQGSSPELALVVVPAVEEGSGVCVWVHGDVAKSSEPASRRAPATVGATRARQSWWGNGAKGKECLCVCLIPGSIGVVWVRITMA